MHADLHFSDHHHRLPSTQRQRQRSSIGHGGAPARSHHGGGGGGHGRAWWPWRKLRGRSTVPEDVVQSVQGANRTNILGLPPYDDAADASADAKVHLLYFPSYVHTFAPAANIVAANIDVVYMHAVPHTQLSPSVRAELSKHDGEILVHDGGETPIIPAAIGEMQQMTPIDDASLHAARASPNDLVLLLASHPTHLWCMQPEDTLPRAAALSLSGAAGEEGATWHTVFHAALRVMRKAFYLYKFAILKWKTAAEHNKHELNQQEQTRILRIVVRFTRFLFSLPTEGADHLNVIDKVWKIHSRFAARLYTPWVHLSRASVDRTTRVHFFSVPVVTLTRSSDRQRKNLYPFWTSVWSHVPSAPNTERLSTLTPMHAMQTVMRLTQEVKGPLRTMFANRVADMLTDNTAFRDCQDLRSLFWYVLGSAHLVRQIAKNNIMWGNSSPTPP